MNLIEEVRAICERPVSTEELEKGRRWYVAAMEKARTDIMESLGSPPEAALKPLWKFLAAPYGWMK